jgi:hypothetical protein
LGKKQTKAFDKIEKAIKADNDTMTEKFESIDEMVMKTSNLFFI